MKNLFLSFAMLIAFGSAMVPTNKVHADDFIDLDLSAVPNGLRGAFRNAEAFWESRVNGYRADLPAAIRSQLTGRLSIDAQVVPIDGPGMVLGNAGPTGTATTFAPVGNPANGLVRQTTVVTSALMNFDIADIGSLAQFSEVVLHEMGHALGFGTVWQQNGIVGPPGSANQGLLQLRNGNFQYIGANGLRGFREQSGHHGANYVPTENGGGPGTALGHWAGGTTPNWFFAPADGSQREILTGFLTGAPFFVSEATFGSLADIGFSVDGINAGVGSIPTQAIGGNRFPKTSRGGFFNLTAVPEPSSAVVLIAGLAGMLVRRHRCA